MRALALFVAALFAIVLAASPASARIALDPIREVVRAAHPRMASCLRGCEGCARERYRLAATFTIEMDGTVSAADVETELPDPDVVQCLVGVIATLRFASRSGGGTAGPGPIRIHYPFVLEP